MRITNSMLSKNMMSNLNSNLRRMEKYQTQANSGRKFDKPSDDPIGMSKSLKLYTDISKVEQYERNLRDATSWMHSTENALIEIGEIFQRTRELSVDMANGTKTEDDTQKAAEEIKQLKDQLVKLGNSRHAGRSIFTGFKTDKDLFKVDGDGKVWYDISLKPEDVSVYNVGIAESIDINIIGSKVFGTKCSANTYQPNYGGEVHPTGDYPILLETFDKLIIAMGTNTSGEAGDFDQEKISNLLGDIDKAHEQILGIRAEIGAKTNRLEMTEKRLSSEKLNFRKVLSLNEDVDYGEVIMEMKMAENVYNASLSVGSKIIQPTLVDFIR